MTENLKHNINKEKSFYFWFTVIIHRFVNSELDGTCLLTSWIIHMHKHQLLIHIQH